MEKIKIENFHKGLTLGQLRAAITWVLRELGIKPAHSARWTVSANYCRPSRNWSGTAYGYVVALRFTSRPLPAVQRARDVVSIAAHELWHLEQFRRGEWGPSAKRTPTGKRKSVEHGAEVARSIAEAAFDAQAFYLTVSWGFVDPPAALAPEEESAEVRAILAEVNAAHAERQRIGKLVEAHVNHPDVCAGCAKWPRDPCPTLDALHSEMHAASDLWDVARKRLAQERAKPARRAALGKARAARTKQAQAREQNARAKLVEWQRALATAERKVAEWRARVRYYDRKAEGVDAAAGAAPPAAE
ncbi:MAG: hypothetical protein M0R37_14690 [Bacteroidales bacterium]|nr:hypothetical protein [Bacteroidales bacterium]